MAEQYIFTIEHLSKAYAKREVLKNIWLAFYPGAKIGVIGSNGAGKSSLLRIMALEDKDFLGTARLTSGFTLGHVPQEPRLNETKDVRGNVEEAVAGTRALLNRHEEISNRLGEPLEPDEMEKLLDELGKVQEKIDAANAWELDRQLEIAMDAMRLPPGDAKASTLSGGERRRVALCKILLQKPDLLLLDEPTNHLDADSVAWLERHLQEYPGTVVSVTHDRYFLDNVAQWILELDRGEGNPFKGNYSSWLEQKKGILEKEERQESARRKALERELEWARMAPRARVAKSKARLAAYEKLAAQEVEDRPEELKMQIPPGPHLGDLVVRAENVRKGYGDNLLMEDLNFDLPRGGIVGIIGANGAGKTTLFRMIVGEEKPDAGTLRVGDTVVLGLRRSEPRRPERSQHRLPGNHRRHRIPDARQDQGGVAGLCLLVQLQGPRSAAQGQRALRRRTQPRPPGQAAAPRRQPAAPRRTDQRSGRRYACVPWKRPCSTSAAARWSSATIAGSSTASPRTSWRSKGTARRSGARGTIRRMRRSGSSGWGPRRISRTGSNIRS